MDHHERDMISGLFERMRAQGPLDKDADAAALIAQGVRANPDAPYMLVQSVLVQEMALQQADERIQRLESQLREAQQASRGAAASGGGGFLGGLFGGGRSASASAPAPANRGSVPSYAPAARSGEPWGGGRAQPAPAASGGGGFMRQAMATAAGVAGGMLLADSIRGMMGGEASKDAASTTETANADQSAGQADYQDPSDNDPGVQDAGWDDGGGFDGGMDI